MTAKNLHLIFFILSAVVLSQPVSAQFQYISPVPGSKMHHPETNIILRNGALIDKTSLLKSDLFTVTGSMSGRHDVKVVLSDDGKTILLLPAILFYEGETVTVTVSNDIKTTSGKTVQGTSFSFETIAPQSSELKKQLSDARRNVYEQEFGPIEKEAEDETDRNIKDWKGGLPVFTIWTNTNPTGGDIFFHNFNFGTDPTAHYCIINNNGDSIYGKYNQAKGNGFTVNHNGYLTMYNTPQYRFEMMDSNYQVISKYYCGNGYLADVHEFQLMADGHSFLIAYDPEPFDMTVYNPSYNPNAIVIGAIVQELDANKNVVFQWRSWDHFEVTDATHTLFTTAQIDYVHANSIELDNDGNIILSCRHMEEVDKISLTTGALIWRWGGSHNQFTFVGDPDKFSYQHDVRRIPNGHITMMDNGNYHTPPNTNAKEYILDEVNKVATLVWKYHPSVSGNSNAMGSVQRLTNGNTLISWGLVYSAVYPSLTEVDAQNNIVWEMRLDPTYNDGIYRAHRITWTPCSRPTTAGLASINITQNSAKLKWANSTNALSYEVQYKKSTGSTWTSVPVTGTTVTISGLAPSTKYNWKVRGVCSAPNPPNSGFTVPKNFTTLPQKLIDNGEVASLDVFPNPAHDVVNLTVNSGTDKQMTVRLTDLLGKTCYSRVLAASENGSTISIPVAQYPAGLYFIEVTSGNEKHVEKVTLQ